MRTWENSNRTFEWENCVLLSLREILKISHIKIRATRHEQAVREANKRPEPIRLLYPYFEKPSRKGGFL